MRIEFENISIIAQGLDDDENLFEVLATEIDNHNYRRISVCSAYVSIKGVMMVRNLISKFSNSEFRWIMGLDDAFTDPNALTLAAFQTNNSQVRISQLQNRRGRKRFHPKIYLLDLNDDEEATIIIGSINLTQAALERNCEVFSVFTATSLAEVTRINEFWDSFWDNAEEVTEEIISAYSQRYRRPPRNPINEEERETQQTAREIRKVTNGIIGSSKIVWIDVGNLTGYQYNQLEIVKDLAPFFELPRVPGEDDYRYKAISSSNGHHVYQLQYHHGIWRFMNLQQGFAERLRPDMSKPSPYRLVFERSNNNTYSMKLFRLDSPKAQQIKNKSDLLGTTRYTGYRYYGWF
jgi:HKD family nuclease